MKQSKKKITTIIGMAVGVTVLTGAVFASYGTSNGYDVAKNAAKGLLKNENYTAKTEMKFALDDKEIINTTVSELYDRNGDVKLERSAKNRGYDAYRGEIFESEDKQYFQDNSYIYAIIPSEGEGYTDIIDNYYRTNVGSFDVLGDSDEEDTDMANKMIRFVELACDTFVGDLKNNVVYVSGDDDSATYEINLDAIQIPEIVNAGLSVMFSSISAYDTNEPFMVLGKDPIVKNAYLKFTVDNEGRLTDAAANAVMSGEGHEASFDITLNMSDYGTTKPQRVDISTLPNVNTKW